MLTTPTTVDNDGQSSAFIATTISCIDALLKAIECHGHTNVSSQIREVAESTVANLTIRHAEAKSDSTQALIVNEIGQQEILSFCEKLLNAGDNNYWKTYHGLISEKAKVQGFFSRFSGFLQSDESFVDLNLSHPTLVILLSLNHELNVILNTFKKSNPRRLVRFAASDPSLCGPYHSDVDRLVINNMIETLQLHLGLGQPSIDTTLAPEGKSEEMQLFMQKMVLDHNIVGYEEIAQAAQALLTTLQHFSFHSCGKMGMPICGNAETVVNPEDEFGTPICGDAEVTLDTLDIPLCGEEAEVVDAQTASATLQRTTLSASPAASMFGGAEGRRRNMTPPETEPSASHNPGPAAKTPSAGCQ